jgi:hypothetical protein
LKATKKTPAVLRMANSSRYHQARRAGKPHPIALTTETDIIILPQTSLKGKDWSKEILSFATTETEQELLLRKSPIFQPSYHNSMKQHFFYILLKIAEACNGCDTPLLTAHPRRTYMTY